MSTWPPSSYFKAGQKAGYDSAFLNSLVSEGNRLLSLGVPVLFSAAHLAKMTDAPFPFINEIISRKKDPYRIFTIKKRSGGKRTICVPHPPLLNTQRWIHRNILLSCAHLVHASSTAYGSNCSPLANAARHCEAKWLVKVDIQNFFESISEEKIYRVFKKIGYRPLLAFELARLTTRLKRENNERSKSKKHYSFYQNEHLGHLPQGAPTSPILANMVCHSMDNDISHLARQLQCAVSRYSDDIVYSGYGIDRQIAVTLIKKTTNILSKHGFSINKAKTQISPPGARKIVTGLLVDGPTPKLNRAYRDNIRCHFYYLKKYGIAEHCKKRGFDSLLGFKNHLNGLLIYAIHIDPAFGEKYQKEFDQIAWPF